MLTIKHISENFETVIKGLKKNIIKMQKQP